MSQYGNNGFNSNEKRPAPDPSSPRNVFNSNGKRPAPDPSSPLNSPARRDTQESRSMWGLFFSPARGGTASLENAAQYPTAVQIPPSPATIQNQPRCLQAQSEYLQQQKLLAEQNKQNELQPSKLSAQAGIEYLREQKELLVEQNKQDELQLLKLAEKNKQDELQLLLQATTMGDKSAQVGIETAQAAREAAQAGIEAAKTGQEAAQAGIEAAKTGQQAAKVGEGATENTAELLRQINKFQERHGTKDTPAKKEYQVPTVSGHLETSFKPTGWCLKGKQDAVALMNQFLAYIQSVKNDIVAKKNLTIRFLSFFFGFSENQDYTQGFLESYDRSNDLLELLNGFGWLLPGEDPPTFIKRYIHKLSVNDRVTYIRAAGSDGTIESMEAKIVRKDDNCIGFGAFTIRIESSRNERDTDASRIVPFEGVHKLLYDK